MRNVRRLPHAGESILFAIGAVALVGCSATASDIGAHGSASLTASPTPNGGVLACSVVQSTTINSVIDLTNDDDDGTINIDRVVVYGVGGGDPVCTLTAPATMGPHQNAAFLTGQMAGCVPQGQVGGKAKFRFIIYWSREGNKNGTLNPLDAWTTMTTFNASNEIVGKHSRECKAITLPPPPPDKCAGVKCRTETICGQHAPCEICVEGECVVNEPNYNAACTPSCGEANRLCGMSGICGATNGQCVPTSTWDCPSCCTQF